MKKSGLFSEELCNGIVDRIGGYSNSNTTDGRVDALTDIILDLCLTLRDNKLVTKKQLRKLTELYPKFKD